MNPAVPASRNVVWSRAAMAAVGGTAMLGWRIFARRSSDAAMLLASQWSAPWLFVVADTGSEGAP